MRKKYIIPETIICETKINTIMTQMSSGGGCSSSCGPNCQCHEYPGAGGCNGGNCPGCNQTDIDHKDYVPSSSKESSFSIWDV